MKYLLSFSITILLFLSKHISHSSYFTSPPMKRYFCQEFMWGDIVQDKFIRVEIYLEDIFVL